MRKLLFFDTETTGLPVFGEPADAPHQPHICSLAAIFQIDDPAAVAEEYETYVRPDGWEVPNEATKVHGLTTEFLTENGARLPDALEPFMKWFDEADMLVAFGVDFDLKMLRGALRRIGLPDRYNEKRRYCVMRNTKNLCRLPPTPKMIAAARNRGRNPGFKTPKLTEAYKVLLGKELDGAHTAIADVRATRDLFFFIETQGEL